MELVQNGQTCAQCLFCAALENVLFSWYGKTWDKHLARGTMQLPPSERGCTIETRRKIQPGAKLAKKTITFSKDAASARRQIYKYFSVRIHKIFRSFVQLQSKLSRKLNPYLVCSWLVGYKLNMVQPIIPFVKRWRHIFVIGAFDIRWHVLSAFGCV